MDGEPTDALRNKVMDWGFFMGSLVAGLTDGINPCAIATMIFLISFLATRKKSRREVLIIGLAYTATVFFTYLAMGLGLKGILEHIRAYHQISMTIRWEHLDLRLLSQH
jgi:cytochrome c biogenesis protein CcdA